MPFSDIAASAHFGSSSWKTRFTALMMSASEKRWASSNRSDYCSHLGTASKALNGQGKLRPETRVRVADAARELGFAPNVLARGLPPEAQCVVGTATIHLRNSVSRNLKFDIAGPLRFHPAET